MEWKDFWLGVTTGAVGAWIIMGAWLWSLVRKQVKGALDARRIHPESGRRTRGD